jgi:hypothetical protein
MRDLLKHMVIPILPMAASGALLYVDSKHVSLNQRVVAEGSATNRRCPALSALARREADETFFSHTHRKPRPFRHSFIFSTTYSHFRPEGARPANSRHAILRSAPIRSGWEFMRYHHTALPISALGRESI